MAFGLLVAVTALLPAPHHLRSSRCVAPWLCAPVEDELCDTESQYCTTALGLRYIDTVVGSGDPISAASEDVITLDYECSLLSSGTVIYSTDPAKGGRGPLCFQLSGSKMPFWEEAVAGMRVGGARRLLVPPSAKLRPLLSSGRTDLERETGKFELQLLTVERGLKASLVKAEVLGSVARSSGFRRARAGVLLLTLVPYLLPEGQRPWIWQAGSTSDIIDPLIESVAGDADPRRAEGTAGGEDGTSVPTPREQRAILRDERSLSGTLFAPGIGSELYGR